LPMSITMRRYLPHFLVAAMLLCACVAVTAGIAMGVSGHSSGAAPAVLHWSNEGIADILTLDPAQGPDYNARQATQLIYGGLVRFGPNFHILPDVARGW